MKVLVTGGAGFIGSNIVKLLSEKGFDVTIFDSLYRRGSYKNLAWILENFPKVNVTHVDIRRLDDVIRTSKEVEFIFHCAAQTAVTTSLEDPKSDFEANALGTFNVMEAARINDCGVVYCSTNKVYGDNVNTVPIKELETRYDFDGKLSGKGIPPDFPINAKEHTPYGCSKLAGELYVKDYNKIYGLPTVVNRMSCIYGLRQFGTTDQGWLSHFIRSVIFDKPLTVYGDGKQVRDILFGEDLARLFLMQAERADKIGGETFNVGGGYKNTISILELLEYLKKLSGKKINVKFSDWRPADQKVYYSDISKLKKIIGWEPTTDKFTGIELLYKWVNENKNLFDI